jgi:protein SCO1
MVRRRFLWGALLAASGLFLSAASWSAFRYGVVSSGGGLPVLGTLPEFSLIASDGKPVSSTDLAGGIWVADFIFTGCASLCPILSGQMARLQSALVREGASAVHLVSFSVDPANDTPKVLRDYAGRFHADSDRWLFVTGERASLHGLISQGFHLAVAERSAGENTDGDGLITHSDRFVLVDRDLRIRGYYHGTETDAMQHLLDDIKTLSKEKPSAVSVQPSAPASSG